MNRRSPFAWRLLLSIVLFATLLCSAQEQHLRPSANPIPKTYFGLHIHRGATTTPWPTVPFGSLRLWDTYTTWADLEPQKGKWNFTLLDKFVDLATQHGVEVLLPIGMPPPWASSRPNEAPDFRKGSAAEPRNMEDWDEYVRTLGMRYKGRVHYWEVWNEPNLKQFYTGDTEHLVALQREAYGILTRIDPANRLISPSPTGDYTGPSWVDSFLSAGGGDFANIIGFHLYVSPKAPEAMVPLIQHVQKVLASKKLLAYKPIWDTETGWYIHSDTKDIHGTSVFPVIESTDAAAYLARAYILTWAAGVQRFFWYDWDSDAMGLTEGGITPKRAAGAYEETYNWLVDAVMTACDADSSETWVCQISRDGNYRGYIIWNPRGSRDFNVPGNWKVFYQRDIVGNSRPISSSRIPIGGSPILLETQARH